MLSVIPTGRNWNTSKIMKMLCIVIASLWELMTPGCRRFGPLGHDWQDLCRVPLNIVTMILNIQASGLVVSVKKIFFMLFIL